MRESRSTRWRRAVRLRALTQDAHLRAIPKLLCRVRVRNFDAAFDQRRHELILGEPPSARPMRGETQSEFGPIPAHFVYIRHFAVVPIHTFDNKGAALRLTVNSTSEKPSPHRQVPTSRRICLASIKSIVSELPSVSLCGRRLQIVDSRMQQRAQGYIDCTFVDEILRRMIRWRGSRILPQGRRAHEEVHAGNFLGKE
jgi:hypothetical protein